MCIRDSLTSPGLGKEVGASLGVIQSFYQGFFLAPTVVSGALKGAIFAAKIYEKLGFKVVPDGTESRHDIIQAVEFNNRDTMIAFLSLIHILRLMKSSTILRIYMSFDFHPLRMSLLSHSATEIS